MEVLELEEDRHPYFMGAQVRSVLAPKLCACVHRFGCVCVFVGHLRSLVTHQGGKRRGCVTNNPDRREVWLVFHVSRGFNCRYYAGRIRLD